LGAERGATSPSPLARFLARDDVRRFRANRSAVVGAAIVLALGLLVLVGPYVVSHEPNRSDFSLSRDVYGAPPGPSAQHWLGTDAIYRDVLARLIYGGRRSLAIALAATILSTAVGTLVGLASGLSEGTRARWLDGLLMRLVDVLLALPFLLFVTAIGVAVGRTDPATILLVLGLLGWTGAARLVRAKTLELKRRDFVTAARALGARMPHIVRRHLLPNLAAPLLVLASSSVGHMILAEALLSYLTVGVAPPDATWGRMLHEAEPYVAVRLGLVAAPGFAILLCVIGWSRVGEGLRDALDPTAERSSRAGRRFPFDLTLAALALGLVAFARPGSLSPPIPATNGDETPARGGTLQLATYVSIRTLDPAIAYDEAATAIEELIFARLLTWDAEGQLVPELAESYAPSNEGRTYTFTLRRGVLFHDGSELRAADLKRSLERTLHPKTPSPAASLYGSIAGFAEYHAGKAPELAGVRVLGDYALAFDLVAPDATFLPLLTMAFAAPVCPSMGATYESAAAAVPCGAGPFRVDSFEPDAGVRLARHAGYFKPGRPYLDGITWRASVRTTTQRYLFEDGELDLLRDMSTADVAAYTRDPAWEGRGLWTTKKATQALFLNTELPPFDDVRVRRAVAFALDPEVLAKIRVEVFPLGRIVPPSIPGAAGGAPLRRHDLAAALEQMALAGYPFEPATGRGGYPEIIEFPAVGDSFDQQIAEVFQQQLARIGLRVRLRIVTYPTFLAEVGRRRRVAMGITGWNADFPDASNFFEPTLSSDAILDEGSANIAFFSNPRFDDVLKRAHGEADAAVRERLYDEAEHIVADQAPWIPLYGTRAHEVMHPYVRGYTTHPFVPSRFSDVWLAPRDEARQSARPLRRLPLAFVPFGLGAPR
jgi:ABC-type dipeptide/oligopeptide/nickel transport system permease subunit/ABC-type transport system substrate-binding protein